MSDCFRAAAYFRRPVVRPRTPGQSYTPAQVAALYGYPKVAAGATPPTIAVLELGGGYVPATIAAWFTQLGLPAPVITEASVRGARNAPGSDADGEVVLDICCAAAAYSACSGQAARLLLIWAPNDASGIGDAIAAAAAHPSRPCVLSCSWGGPEDSWGSASIAATEAALKAAVAAGMAVYAASGDNGADDGEAMPAADYPASSAYAAACGGTTIQAAGGRITSEIGWSSEGGAGGGGQSKLFPRPAFQAGVVSLAGRGSPDLSMDADPDTGYQTPMGVIGGTSAVAPMAAALHALCVQATGVRVGLPNAIYYAHPQAFRDVTAGNNGFSAGPGWDEDTGLGAPIGAAILAAWPSGTTPPPPPGVTAAQVVGIDDSVCAQALGMFARDHRVVAAVNAVNHALDQQHKALFAAAGGHGRAAAELAALAAAHKLTLAQVLQLLAGILGVVGPILGKP